MDKIKCPLCSSIDLIGLENNQSYFECNNCNGIFVFPLGEQKKYLESFNYLSDPEVYISLIDPKGFRFLIGHFEKHFLEKTGKNRGSVLEIGAGVGYSSFMLFSRDWEVEGVETSELSTAWANKYLKMPVYNTTIENFNSKNKFDAVFMIEVIEHFLSADLALESIV